MQYTTSLGSNPFAVLTAVVAPAILTNASSVLALGTSNRLGRVVDRTRVVAAELAGFEPGSADYQAWAAQLDRLQERAQLLLKALRGFYASLGLFACAALVSVGGSIAAYYGQKYPSCLGGGARHGYRSFRSGGVGCWMRPDGARDAPGSTKRGGRGQVEDEILPRYESLEAHPEGCVFRSHVL